jgi:hypothetical protein
VVERGRTAASCSEKTGQEDEIMKRSVALCVLLAGGIAAAAGSKEAPAAAGDPAGWQEFEGSWSAAGSVRTMSLGGARQTSVADLSGTLLLAGPSRPGIGFRGDAFALSDTESGMVGRAVWTDNHGDRVFSELRGGGPARGSHVTGTFVGGTGRYAGATGTYEFTWQYVMAAEDGTMQGRAIDLKGRVRTGQGKVQR